MNRDDVLALLEANQDPRGMARWDRRGSAEGGLSTYGIGLTRLRKLAKGLGRDHALAEQLWQSDNYDARVVGLLIDEPKKLTREQAERQVEDVDHGLMAHVFSACDATLAKAPFVVELADDWVHSDHPVRKRCGYGLLYEISKDKRKRAPDEAFFLRHIQHIRDTQATAPTQLRMSMAGALLGIGKRSRTLNAAALVVSLEMGPIPGSEGCDPFNLTKHLTSPYLVKKLGL